MSDKKAPPELPDDLFDGEVQARAPGASTDCKTCLHPADQHSQHEVGGVALCDAYGCNCQGYVPRRVIGRPFQKGQSGNPSGIPKEIAQLKIELRGCGAAAAVKIMERLIDLALRSPDGRIAIAAAREVFDRTVGKSPQALTDAEGGKLQGLVVLPGVIPADPSDPE